MASTSKANSTAVSGDALDDEFELDNSLIADEISDDGLDNDGAQSSKSRSNSKKSRMKSSKKAVLEDEEDDFDVGSDADDQGADTQPSSSKKRKLQHDDTERQQPLQNGALSAADKKKRRKDKAKEAKARSTAFTPCKANLDSLIAPEDTDYRYSGSSSRHIINRRTTTVTTSRLPS